MHRPLWLLVLLLAVASATAPLARPADGRSIPLQDPKANFRELGGLPTTNGAVRSNLIYRSAALAGLSPQDVRALQGLHIRTLVDLRKASEISTKTADPPAWLQTLQTRLLLTLDGKGALSGTQYYQFVLRQHPAEIRTFFGLLAETNQLPLLFHCAHGKDRTGIMAALLLMCLGTPREAITADYLQSHGTGEVKRAWIEACYQEVDAAGGIDPFLDRCGVSAETRRRVRTNLTRTVRTVPP